MDWQQVSALAIVAATAGLLAWGRLRPRRGLGRSHSCPGCNTSGSPPRETVVFHARKGERPEVRIRPVDPAPVARATADRR